MIILHYKFNPTYIGLGTIFLENDSETKINLYTDI